eukprot:CAMPEP_0184701000 /NCGR_PEP_ID=MMETSP0313-20130426/17533_1 /TAXON_ID=2792 /ORGANISM="Porphyridium aerugineum, Strain SAG 1380-2" /LENGTH=77 /DNA_ID=CAMNT_0027160905 /DNA_START=39 /DNA_END=272 /DNA_ORIENTATION=+
MAIVTNVPASSPTGTSTPPRNYKIGKQVNMVVNKTLKAMRVIFQYGYVPLIIYWGLKSTPDGSVLNLVLPPMGPPPQ